MQTRGIMATIPRIGQSDLLWSGHLPYQDICKCADILAVRITVTWLVVIKQN